MRLRQGLSLLYATACVSCSIVLAIWYGMNSDRGYIPPVLTKLIPAGHCSCLASTDFQCSECFSCVDMASQQIIRRITPTWAFEYHRDAHNETLGQDQCYDAFPGLFEDILRGRHYWQSQGGVVKEDLDAIPSRSGMARVFIYKGSLHVVSALARNEYHREKILGVLSAIHRALVADCDRASRRDIEFVFWVNKADSTLLNHPIWAFARIMTEESVWLMPEFSYRAWDNTQNYFGPYDQSVAHIQRHELHWGDKKPRLIWRGNPKYHPNSNRLLKEALSGKPWGDVEQLEWSAGASFLDLEDLCRYMFIAHVEDSYTASLKHKQACNSVIVTPRPRHIQHHHSLLVPSGPEQNYVEVSRNLSDLTDKIEPLVRDTDAAARIAYKSVKTFRDRYLTPAAEACYWRELFKAYSSVWNSTVEFWGDRKHKERGLRYESFLLLPSFQQLDFKA